MADDQGGATSLFDDVGHREGLACACCAQQDLVMVPRLDRLGQFADRLGLIPGWREVADNLKV